MRGWAVVGWVFTHPSCPAIRDARPRAQARMVIGTPVGTMAHSSSISSFVHRDAARGPIAPAAASAAHRLAMDEDVAAGAVAHAPRARHVERIGIADAERQVELAARVAAVDPVAPLGSAPVARGDLVPLRGKAQVHLVLAQASLRGSAHRGCGRPSSPPDGRRAKPGRTGRASARCPRTAPPAPAPRRPPPGPPKARAGRAGSCGPHPPRRWWWCPWRPHAAPSRSLVPSSCSLPAPEFEASGRYCL